MIRHPIGSLLFGLVLVGSLAGCGGSYGGLLEDPAAQRKPEELLNNIRATLKESNPSVALYENAIQQLNSYLEQRRDIQEDMKLAGEQRTLIMNQLLQHLSKAEREEKRMKELERTSFSSNIDAHHLDSCFLFRDAAESLKRDVGAQPAPGAAGTEDLRSLEYQLRVAQRALDWVGRQVFLQPPIAGRDPWPPHEVLRRGTGSAEERARVFLALVEQLNLPGCMIAVIEEKKNEEGKSDTRERLWIPGVLIGNDVYLFDTNLGLPIPGPDGKGVATLKQVRAKPALLQALPSEITAAQLEKAIVLIPSTLPALSPRMRWLQGALSDNPAVLHQSLPESLRRFKEANLGAEVKLWTSRQAYPAILLPRYVENPRNEPRLQAAIMPRHLLPEWYRQIANQPGPGLGPRQHNMYRTFDILFLRTRIEPGGARDYLARGRPEQAMGKILDSEASLDRVLDHHRKLPDVVPGIRQEWAKKLQEAEERLAQAIGRAQEQRSQAAQEEARQLALAVDGIIKEQVPNFHYLAHEWAAPELRAYYSYLMGLAKMEQATRGELLAASSTARPADPTDVTPAQQWESAASWFGRYQAIMLPQSKSPWTTAVQFHLATCRAAQQRYGAAVALLEQVKLDPPDSSSEAKYLNLVRSQLIKNLRQKQASKTGSAK